MSCPIIIVLPKDYYLNKRKFKPLPPPHPPALIFFFFFFFLYHHLSSYKAQHANGVSNLLTLSLPSYATVSMQTKQTLVGSINSYTMAILLGLYYTIIAGLFISLLIPEVHIDLFAIIEILSSMLKLLKDKVLILFLVNL